VEDNDYIRIFNQGTKWKHLARLIESVYDHEEKYGGKRASLS